jgi:hypothetical protein
MHLAYTFSPSGRSLCIFGIDAQGETWDVARQSVAGGEHGARVAVQAVWTFATKIMTRGAIEWRLAVTRLGIPSMAELEGASLLLTVVASS